MTINMHLDSQHKTRAHTDLESRYFDLHYDARLHLIAHVLSCINSLFTALHEMQTRSSDENSVCPSVRPSVTRVIPDKMEERSVQIFIPYERTIILVF